MWLWKTFVSGSVTSWLKFCKVSQSKYSIYFEMRKMNIQGKTKKRNWLIQKHFLLRYGPKPTHLTPSCSYWWSLFCNKCIVWLWYKIRVLITWDERSWGPSCKNSYELLCCASNLNNSTLFFSKKIPHSFIQNHSSLPLLASPEWWVKRGHRYEAAWDSSRLLIIDMQTNSHHCRLKQNVKQAFKRKVCPGIILGCKKG